MNRYTRVIYTIYQARYKAFLLFEQRHSKSFERYLPALMSADIDLHPHQIDAAVFANTSPFSEGIVIADEEDLGKRIVAGIVLLQNIIEEKKNLLILCNKDYMQRWVRELKEKFDITISDFNKEENDQKIILLSYQEASQRSEEISCIDWNLCIFDNAHELIGTYQSKNIKINNIIHALKDRRKLLLTSTPMQNSVLDLYYLLRLLDNTIFGGSEELFKRKYLTNRNLEKELVDRIQMICQRTLKRQVLTIQFTNRIVRTIFVSPSQEEESLSKRMSLYFHRKPLLAFPNIKTAYIRLIYWKLMASSISALVAGFDKALERLAIITEGEEELADLNDLLSLAKQIKKTRRSEVFLEIIHESFRKLRDIGAEEKIIVFSENRTTLQFLYALLRKHKYKVVVASPDKMEKVIRVFKRNVQILLTTDKITTSWSLPFCSCVINYDIPWNVQKLERRISCCHTYNQKHDVLVINFIDPTNRADRRLYTVLNKKLKKFDEVFGVSETVLGDVINEGNDLDIYLRTEEEIKEEQDFFRKEHQEEISQELERAKNNILAHFDEDVAKKFEFYSVAMQERMKEYEDSLWALTKYSLQGKAILTDEERSIIVSMTNPPFKGLRLSRIDFKMGRNIPRGQRYTSSSPLAKAVVSYCLEGELRTGLLRLQSGGDFKSGDSGVVGLWKASFLSTIEYTISPILCGYMGSYELSHEACDTLMQLEVIQCSGGYLYKEDIGTDEELEKYYRMRHDERLHAIQERKFTQWREEQIQKLDEEFQKELKKLERWCKEEIESVNLCIAVLEEEQKILKRKRGGINSFIEKANINKNIADLQRKKKQEEERIQGYTHVIFEKKKDLINECKKKIYFECSSQEIFIIHFQVE